VQVSRKSAGNLLRRKLTGVRNLFRGQDFAFQEVLPDSTSMGASEGALLNAEGWEGTVFRHSPYTGPKGAGLGGR
jgi:hypothetical protein